MFISYASNQRRGEDPKILTNTYKEGRGFRRLITTTDAAPRIPKTIFFLKSEKNHPIAKTQKRVEICQN